MFFFFVLAESQLGRDGYHEMWRMIHLAAPREFVKEHRLFFFLTSTDLDRNGRKRLLKIGSVVNKKSYILVYD